MSHHACANCRRVLSANVALVSGRFCEKCRWAAAAAEFRDDVPTRRKIIVPLSVLAAAA
ncbi:MAG TPA: hypothetical protein VGL86_09480 [Polyangia bacterium]|jgi:hypothetical protein